MPPTLCSLAGQGLPYASMQTLLYPAATHIAGWAAKQMDLCAFLSSNSFMRFLQHCLPAPAVAVKGQLETR